jgi:hypothetical protein
MSKYTYLAFQILHGEFFVAALLISNDEIEYPTPT